MQKRKIRKCLLSGLNKNGLINFFSSQIYPNIFEVQKVIFTTDYFFHSIINRKKYQKLIYLLYLLINMRYNYE